MDHVIRQMHKGLVLRPEVESRGEDAGQELACSLNRALRPALLLRLEARDDDRQLRRTHEVRQIHDGPTAKLGAVTEVEILGERVMGPAAGVLDRGAPPDPGRPVEVEEEAALAARRLLDSEVAVDAEGLGHGEKRE